MQLAPVPTVSEKNQILVLKINDLVSKIQRTKESSGKESTKTWEDEIDDIVYRLYDLNDYEIEMVALDY